MEPSDAASSFLRTGAAYDAFMGRYSNPLAARFADVLDLSPGMRLLDVGCGPGGLTRELVARAGAGAVTAVDPSPPFVDACTDRCPGASVRLGDAQDLPFPDAGFDGVVSQLVLHFVPDPAQAGAEFRRVVRPGGFAAASGWDVEEEMEIGPGHGRASVGAPSDDAWPADQASGCPAVRRRENDEAPGRGLGLRTGWAVRDLNP